MLLIMFVYLKGKSEPSGGPGGQEKNLESNWEPRPELCPVDAELRQFQQAMRDTRGEDPHHSLMEAINI